MQSHVFAARSSPHAAVSRRARYTTCSEYWWWLWASRTQQALERVERERGRGWGVRERGMGRSSVVRTKAMQHCMARSESTRQAVTGDLPSSGQPRRRRRWRHPPQQLSTAIPTNSSITQAPALMLCARAVMAVPISNKRRSVYVRLHRESKEEA